MHQNRCWHFPPLSGHRLTFTALTATRQSLPRNLVMCNSWIRESPDRRNLICSHWGFDELRAGSWRFALALGLACRSDSWTHSTVRSDGGSCHGDRSQRVCTSVVLIFGRPSDASRGECFGPNSRSGDWLNIQWGQGSTSWLGGRQITLGGWVGGAGPQSATPPFSWAAVQPLPVLVSWIKARNHLCFYQFRGFKMKSNGFLILYLSSEVVFFEDKIRFPYELSFHL